MFIDNFVRVGPSFVSRKETFKSNRVDLINETVSLAEHKRDEFYLNAFLLSVLRNRETRKTKLANRKLKCSIKACNAIKKKKRHELEGGRLTALPESQKLGRFDLAREIVGFIAGPGGRPRTRAPRVRAEPGQMS